MGAMEIRDTDLCVERLKALGDTTRLRVVEALSVGPLHVAEIKARIGIEGNLLSHHLKVLRRVGLVEQRRDGRSVLYSLRPEVRGTGEELDLGCCSLRFESGKVVR